MGLASSGTLILNRPDKLHATRKGGFADVEMDFDGKTMTLLRKDSNQFAKIEEPGTIDQLVDALRDKYHRPVPAADLLMADPNKELMPSVVDVKDLEAESPAGSNATISLSEATRWIGRFGSPRATVLFPAAT